MTKRRIEKLVFLLMAMLGSGVWAAPRSVTVSLEVAPEWAAAHQTILVAVNLIATTPSHEIALGGVVQGPGLGDVHIVAMSSQRLQAQLAGFRSQGAMMSDTLDALTTVMVIADKPQKVMFLLMDRLTTDAPNGEVEERSDALMRLSVALAHEFYGNVASILSEEGEILATAGEARPTLSRSRQIRHEIAAFRAGVAFIDRLQIALGHQLGQKMSEDLRVARVRELKMLATWEAAAFKLAASLPAQECAALLGAALDGRKPH